MTIIIAGAGLSGLACALTLADHGYEVELHEAAPQAGGRCRSWFDAGLQAEIDNGTHLIAGGNHAAWSYLRRIGSERSLFPLPAVLPMMDIDSKRRWNTPNPGLLPSLVAALPRLICAPTRTVAQSLGRSRRYDDFWHPLALAALNTDPARAQAVLLRRVLARTIWRGAAASRLYKVGTSLSASFIDPAIAELRNLGVSLHFQHPLRRIIIDRGKARDLVFADQVRSLSRHDRLVLALPAHAAYRLWPGLPDLPHNAIANLHFRMTVAQADRLPEALGMIGGQGQWLFKRGKILSMTISDAPEMSERSVGSLWAEICQALEMTGEIPTFRLIREKRATLRHTAETEASRRSPLLAENVFLCGDMADTKLPGTIEGAILSGLRAARLCLRR